MSGHTPGPWDFDGVESADVFAGEDIICTVFFDPYKDGLIEAERAALLDRIERQVRNGRLIAAAPDLLEVARMIESEAQFLPQRVIDAARAAIAKAKGGEG